MRPGPGLVQEKRSERQAHRILYNDRRRCQSIIIEGHTYDFRSLLCVDGGPLSQVRRL